MQRNGAHNYYLCVGDPTHRDPIIQARIPTPIANRRVDRHHQLPRHHQLLIERLCYNHQQEEVHVPEPMVLEDVPVLVEEEEQEVEEEPLVEDDIEQLP